MFIGGALVWSTNQDMDIWWLHLSIFHIWIGCRSKGTWAMKTVHHWNTVIGTFQSCHLSLCRYTVSKCIQRDQWWQQAAADPGTLWRPKFCPVTAKSIQNLCAGERFASQRGRKLANLVALVYHSSGYPRVGQFPVLRLNIPYMTHTHAPYPCESANLVTLQKMISQKAGLT